MVFRPTLLLLISFLSLPPSFGHADLPGITLNVIWKVFILFFFFTSLIIWTFIEHFLYARHCSKTLPAISYSRPCHDGLNELCGMILATRNTGMTGPRGFRGLPKSLQLIWRGATLQTQLVCTQSPCYWSSLPRLSKWPP